VTAHQKKLGTAHLFTLFLNWWQFTYLPYLEGEGWLTWI